MLASVPLADWEVYLKANSIGSHDDLLSKPFQDAGFEYSKVISGQSEQQSRSKQMVRRVDRQIGFALGQLYVKRHFNEDAKKLLLGEKEPSMQFTTPEELAALALFFCSPAGNNVRGAAWNMDGGWAAQ